MRFFILSLWIAIPAAISMFAGVARAQSSEQYFQEQQQRQQQAFNAEQSRRGYESSQQNQQSSQPRGEWKEAWGAVATDNSIGVLGVVVGSPTRRDAEQSAVADCRAKGGKTCKIDLAYANQCGVMILGAKNYIMKAAESIESATRIGMEECNATDSNCRLYYSACSKPEYVNY